MSSSEIAPAFSSEALLGKSKTYIARALAARNRGDMGECQLWASLALELLGKSALAAIHPCLIVDPQSQASMFAAAGLNIGTDLKTITAKTLFERLSHISTRFDKKTQEYCMNMSLRRNAELHSGEVPFEGVVPSSWEGRFWHTAHIVLEAKGLTIEQWLGASDAKAPKDLLENYAHALAEATKVRIETAGEEFGKRPKKEREEALERASAITTWQMRKAFNLITHDGIWEEKCPACGSRSFIAGVKYAEEVSDEYDRDFPEEETVEIYLVAEEFLCPSCALHLESREEIEAADLQVEHTEVDVRRREYEPDYGND